MKSGNILPLEEAGLFCFLLFAAYVYADDSADWTDLIPAADLNALKKNTNAQNAMMNAAPGAPRVFQEDLVGCNPSAKPPCPVQNKPIPFTTQTDSSGVPVVTIPFALAPLADGYDAVFSAILEGFEDMEKTSGCISFKSLEELPGDRKQYKAFLNITEGPMCSAKFGDPNRPAYHVTLNKDCISRKKGIIQRLVMLALGFPHTITRNDRDSFININWDNVLPDKKEELYMDDPTVHYDEGDEYDYESVLHPGYTFLAQALTIPTIYGKVKVRLGHNDKFSNGDGAKVKRVICDGKPLFTIGEAKSTKKSARPKQTATTTEVPVDSSASTEGGQNQQSSSDLKKTKSGKAPKDTSQISPSRSQPCKIGDIVVVENSQVMSKSVIKGKKTKLFQTTSMATRWFSQKASDEFPLDQPVDYTAFAGKVDNVVTSTISPSMLTFQSVYAPVNLADGGKKLQTKFETRTLLCTDTPPHDPDDSA